MKNMEYMLRFFAAVLMVLSSCPIHAQLPVGTDSITIRVKPGYDSVGRFHRKLLGDNYRREYALRTKVPILRMSALFGGLKATEKGGGNQSRSLRLIDGNGSEWVLRSVEKYPEVLLPAPLRNTFARDIIKDNMVSQHPFSALVVADLAMAAGIPHSTPIIGWVVADANLGIFASEFANSLCLLEQREPLGSSDNTQKMYAKLNSSHDIGFDGPLYLRARALDVLIGDWDRHEDQWRWKLLKSDKGAVYVPVPRDRDQVFFRSDGWIQRFSQSSWLLPMMQGYERDIKNINWFLWEGRELNSRFFAGISEQEWNVIIRDFCAAMSDDVLEFALRKLPAPNYALRHEELLVQLKKRRAMLPALMAEYFRFYHRIIDIEVSNGNEKIEINDTVNKGLHIDITKIGKNSAVLFDKTFDPELTREIRIYLHDGDDSLIVSNGTSPIKLRIIGGRGNKSYRIDSARQRILLYSRKENARYGGEDVSKLTKKLSNDSANISYVAKDLYKRTFKFLNAGYNVDDGPMIGLSYRIKSPGFRKAPYRDSQTFSFLYSFGTSAFKFSYKGEWTKLFGSADLVLYATANAPSNTQNFFGFGNATKFHDKVDKVSYFRARFDSYQFDPSLRWSAENSTFSIGPSFQYYHYSAGDNVGRFITDTDQLHSYDSLTIGRDKAFIGLAASFVNDGRDNPVLPKNGALMEIKFRGYEGLNHYASSFAQLDMSISFYQKLDPKGNLVLAERIGGGTTVGKPAFFQSQFLGGHANLLGFRQYRFAGKHSLYSNLELRLKLGNFINYVIPGEIGLMGLYDVGRVWVPGEKSDALHHGLGGGIYFAPASLTVFRLMATHSREGWYPYASLGLRY